jgi:hypothetical protein
MPSFPDFMAPLEGGGAPPADSAGSLAQRILPVEMTPQEETNWCWSAVTQAVLRFVHTRQVEQHAIATAHVRTTGKTYSCDQPKRRKQTPGKRCGDANCGGACNDAHFLRLVLREQGCFAATLTQGAPTFAQIQAEIDNQRPLPCRIQWRPLGGHFVLVTGWLIGADGVERVRVLDPAANEGSAAIVERTLSHQAFTTQYRGTLGTGYVNYSYRVS